MQGILKGLRTTSGETEGRRRVVVSRRLSGRHKGAWEGTAGSGLCRILGPRLRGELWTEKGVLGTGRTLGPAEGVQGQEIGRPQWGAYLWEPGLGGMVQGMRATLKPESWVRNAAWMWH